MLAGRPAAGQAPDISSCVWFLEVDLFAFPQSVSPITQK
jgi:hypothetical protein